MFIQKFIGKKMFNRFNNDHANTNNDGKRGSNKLV